MMVPSPSLEDAPGVLLSCSSSGMASMSGKRKPSSLFTSGFTSGKGTRVGSTAGVSLVGLTGAFSTKVNSSTAQEENAMAQVMSERVVLFTRWRGGLSEIQ